MSAVNTSRESPGFKQRYPDIGFIKAKIPIRDVANRLGIRVKGCRAHCWRVENHSNGDADPSMSFDNRKNRGRCFVCDERSWSVIDLVMMFLGLDIRRAVEWIASRFYVPTVPRGKHLSKHERWFPNYRVGVSSSNFELIVRSGLWATFTHAQRAMFAVLVVFTDLETGLCQISYGGIRRYAGVGSSTTVAAGIRRLRQLHLLQTEQRVTGCGFRECNLYRLTFDDPHFLNLLKEIHRSHQEEIELERALRAEQRMDRRLQREAAPPVKVNTLSTECSTGKFGDTPYGEA